MSDGDQGSEDDVQVIGKKRLSSIASDALKASIQNNEASNDQTITENSEETEYDQKIEEYGRLNGRKRPASQLTEVLK